MVKSRQQIIDELRDRGIYERSSAETQAEWLRMAMTEVGADVSMVDVVEQRPGQWTPIGPRTPEFDAACHLVLSRLGIGDVIPTRMPCRSCAISYKSHAEAALMCSHGGQQ